MIKNSLGGAHYLSKGFRLIWLPEIRNFVLIPLLVNLLLLSTATFYAINKLSQWHDSLYSIEDGLTQWLVTHLGWLIWPIVLLSVLLLVFFLFAFLANWIAAPFNGLLAEAVEKYLAGTTYRQQTFSWKRFIQDIPGLLAREWRKLVYYLPRALGCLLLFLTPLALFAPLLWFLFCAWMAAIQYIDYPMDNHRISFKQMLIKVKQNKGLSLSFGSLVMLLTLIPVVNILIMPVAVAGATNLWYDQLRD